MKHVFIIGSHSPYLTALGTIEHLNLSKDDVIFLFGRHYNCSFHDVSYKTIDISDDYIIYFRNNNRKSLIKIVEVIDSLIETIIIEEYTLYVPHFNTPYHQILATNKKCRDVKFIQEGIVDLCSDFKISQAIYCWFINTFIIRSSRMWKTYKWNSTLRLKTGVRISETFAITDKLFRHINTKHSIVKWPSFPIDVRIEPDSSIFIFESAVEMKLVSIDIFLEAIEKMIIKYGKRYNYIKFHPFQSDENRKAILCTFQACGLNINVLDDSIPFELIMSSKQNLNIYGFTTSLVFMGALLGHNAISFAPSIIKNKTIKRHWNNLYEHLCEYGNNCFAIEDL